MKAVRKFLISVVAVVLLLAVVACGTATTTETEEEATETTTVTTTDLSFNRHYIIMPALNIRADAETEGKVDTLYAGDEVFDIQKKGDYTEFSYYKDGELRSGATWTGGISQGIRIHLLKDEFVFHRPYQTREDLGSIVTWREPTDPDLLILWKEGEWLYVLSLEDCRAGYMSADASYEIVE